MFASRFRSRLDLVLADNPELYIWFLSHKRGEKSQAGS